MTTNFNWMKNSSSWQWRTSILFSYSREKVTDYSMAPRSNVDIVSGNYDSPLVGYPYNAIFSFRYQGLDGNGNPVGYLAGAPSTDYAKITASYLADELIFHGSATPQVFGALRNQLKGLTLTVNLSYKFDYYVRRHSVFNGNNYGFNSFGFGQRWQAPGDEQLTNIPSLVYPANAAKGTLANYGQHLVERADHIRLQYLQLHYPLKVKGWLSGGSSSVYFNMSNLGTVWKLTKHNYDPEFNYGKPPLLATLGVKLNLN